MVVYSKALDLLICESALGANLICMGVVDCLYWPLYVGFLPESICCFIVPNWVLFDLFRIRLRRYDEILAQHSCTFQCVTLKSDLRSAFNHLELLFVALLNCLRFISNDKASFRGTEISFWLDRITIILFLLFWGLAMISCSIYQSLKMSRL